MPIITKNSEVANKNQQIAPALHKIANLETLDNDLKSKVAKSLKEFKAAVKSMGEKFQDEVLNKFQDGFDDQGRPKVKEGSEEEFKKEQTAYGEREVVLQCAKLDSKLLLGIDGISAADVVNLDFMSDFE